MAGGLAFLANPPVDIGPVAFVALVPLLWAMRGRRPGGGAGLGFVFGLTYYGLVLHWLLPFGVIAWLPLVLSQAGYAALFGAVGVLGGKATGWDDRPVVGAAVVGGAWIAVDWARGAWPLGGFTWGALAYTQHGNHLLLPVASVTGMWGVTFVVVAVNVLALSVILRLLRGQWRRTVPQLAVAAALLTLPALIPLPAAMGRPLDVAVVQGNVPRALASDRLLQTADVAKNHIALNRRLAGDPPDLAIWPENSLAEDPAIDPVLGAAVARSIRTVGSPTLVGAIAPAPGGRFYNQAILYSGSGQIEGRYTKLHLVPGGEYIPWKTVLGWTQRYRRGNAILAPGTRLSLFTVHGLRVGTPICFENVFPALFRRFVSAGAQIMVLTTNDSSFLESEASREHVIISQIRAVETGRWVVQAAISGESAIIDPTGRVRAHTGLFQKRILRAIVPTSSAETPYVRLGDWFPWLAGLGLLVGGAIRWARGRRGRRPGAPPAGEEKRIQGRDPAPIAGGSGPRSLVVLPTYNERDTIARVVAGILAAAPEIDILVVDDSSPDGTGEVVQAMAEREPRVRILERAGKLGLASAYLVGFRQALDQGYEVVVEMDSDLSHQPEELPTLLEATARYDLVIGSRYVPGGAVSNWSKARLAISRGGNAYTRALLRIPFHDATSGFRAYRRIVLEALLSGGIRSEGYAFQVELAYQAWRQGFSVGEVPITFREREQGQSKFSRTIVLEALAKVTRWGLRDRFGRLPRAEGDRGL